MTVKRLVCSYTSQRLLVAQEWIETVSHDGELVVLAPTRGAVDDLVRNLSLKTGGLLGVHRMTLFQLAATLATPHLAVEQLSALSLLGAEALAARTVHHCLKEQTLSYFAPVASMPGFARALASTISELRLENIVPSDLASVGQPGPDLATLLERFEQELAAQALADLSSLFKFSEEIIVNGNHYLLRLPIVLLDVSFRSALEKRFLQSLVQQAPAVLGTVVGGHSENKKALSELLGVAAEELEMSH